MCAAWQSCRLFPGSSPLHVDLDALLQQTDTRHHQHQQLSSEHGASHTSALDSTNSARAALALSSPPVDTWYEQLRSIVEEHVQDSAKWDVWAEEEHDNLVNDAQAAQVCQHSSKCNKQVDSSWVEVHVRQIRSHIL